jgi:predicted nucleic acid-binding protein
VTLVDSSAWIEYLRATGSQTHRALRGLLEQGEDLHTTDVVVMEVLAGARDDDHRDRLRRLLARCEYLPVEGLGDYEAAADIFRICREAGVTIRSLTDCLIAVVAIRRSLPVLHADRDFEALARHTGLRVHASSLGTRF